MKGRTKLICCILSICMLMSSVSLSVSAGWDGYVTTKEDSSFTLVSMNSFSTIAKSGAAPDHTKKKHRATLQGGTIRQSTEQLTLKASDVTGRITQHLNSGAIQKKPPMHKSRWL